MPSKLVFCGFYVNQVLNNLQISTLPLRWHPDQRRWLLYDGQSRKTMLKNFLFSISWKSLLALVACLSVYHLFQDKLFFSIRKCIASVLFFLVSACVVFLDIMLLVYGKEIVSCCNWLCVVENIWKRVLMENLLGSRNIRQKRNRIDIGKLNLFYLGQGLLFAKIE